MVRSRTPGETPTFRVATFVNDAGMYAGMLESFQSAGFVEPVARYTVEQGDPYAAISRLGRVDEPYVILVHQDVRCDQGDGAEALLERLDELTRKDDRWAVAGNAGGTRALAFVRHLADRYGTERQAQLPLRVRTLDENLLVLRTARSPVCSHDLSGFHLYGTDVCLNAAQSGSTAYIIDFMVTHLGRGDIAGFAESAESLASSWSRRVVLPRYVLSSCALIPIARPNALRRLIGHPRVIASVIRQMNRVLR